MDPLGKQEDIAKINNQTLVKYIDDHFVSENVVVVVKSNLEFEEIKEKFEKYFANKVKSDRTKRVCIKKHIYEPENNFVQVQINNSLKTVEIDIAYKATDSSRENSLYTYVEDYVFNNSFHGRLLKKLRTENGLVYSASYSPVQILGGMYYNIFDITTSKDKVNRALEVFGEIITDIGKNGITQEELDNLKNKIIIAEQDRATGIKTTDLFSLFYRYLNCDELFYNNQLHKVKDLTLEQVNSYFKKVYDQKEVFILIAGDVDYKNMHKEDEIFKLFNAHRTRYLYMIDEKAVLDIKTNKTYKKEDFDKAVANLTKEEIAKICTTSYVINQNPKKGYELNVYEDMPQEEKLNILQEVANNLGLDNIIFTMSDGEADKSVTSFDDKEVIKTHNKKAKHTVNHVNLYKDFFDFSNNK